MHCQARSNVLILITIFFACIMLFFTCVTFPTRSSTDFLPQHPIHIAMLVVDNEFPNYSSYAQLKGKKVGISASESVETLVKSILTFYTGSLHLHLLTNTRSGNILSTLFQTWHLTRVRTSFYNVEENHGRVEWVKAKNEWNEYDQLKYIIHDILPDHLDKVILMDSDMLVLEDISILNNFFTEMDQKGVMFASTHEQYERKNLEKSLGKGAGNKSVNSGLLLLNLKAMRMGNWSDLWRAEGVKLMNKIGRLESPQDLFAAIAIARPELYMKLPCEYNFQIGKGALLWECAKNKSQLGIAKIPHWSGAASHFDTAAHAEYYAPIYRCFQKMDGYEFEAKKISDGIPREYRTLLNLRNTRRTEVVSDVTLVTSADFVVSIDLIQRLTATWKGPISLVVYGNSWERAQLLEFLLVNQIHDLFDVHFVYARRIASPGDYLRRVSIEAARTQYVLLVDDVFEIEFDEDLRMKCILNNSAEKTFVLRYKKTSNFAGVLLDKLYALRLAAGSLRLEEGIKPFKLKLDTIEVNSADANYKSKNNVTNWKTKMPLDSFCNQEIDKRRK